MEKKWNLQDIKPVTERKKKIPPEDRPQMDRPMTKTVTEENDGTLRLQIENSTKKGGRHLVLAFSLFFVVIIAGLSLSYIMRGAVVTVYPKHREPTVNATFEAYRVPQAGELSYEIMSLEADGERQVSASGQEEVKELATGMLTIYKNTPGAERLIKNTRFESPTGLIFRISESAVVPGAVKNTEGELVPGFIKAKVFADTTGENYNLIASNRFTVPGFKEGNFTELYNAIYAENEEPFVGGFEGSRFIIDESELNTAKQALQMELRDALLGRVPNEKPSGFVVFDPAITFTYQSLPAVEYGDNLATIKEKALLQIPIFKADEFSAYVAGQAIPGFEKQTVRIDNINDLAFSYTNATTSSSDIGNLNSIEFKIVGKPQIVWTFDEGRLKADLLGATKTALPTILGAYPAIERAEAVVKPFWKRAFPKKLDEIEIVESIVIE